jgi:hypothetical protein
LRRLAEAEPGDAPVERHTETEDAAVRREQPVAAARRRRSERDDRRVDGRFPTRARGRYTARRQVIRPDALLGERSVRRRATPREPRDRAVLSRIRRDGS